MTKKNTISLQNISNTKQPKWVYKKRILNWNVVRFSKTIRVTVFHILSRVHWKSFVENVKILFQVKAISRTKQFNNMTIYFDWEKKLHSFSIYQKKSNNFQQLLCMVISHILSILKLHPFLLLGIIIKYINNRLISPSSSAREVQRKDKGKRNIKFRFHSPNQLLTIYERTDTPPINY